MKHKKPREHYHFIITSGTDARKKPVSFNVSKSTIILAISGTIVVIAISLSISFIAYSKISDSEKQIRDLNDKLNKQSQLLDQYTRQLTADIQQSGKKETAAGTLTTSELTSSELTVQDFSVQNPMDSTEHNNSAASVQTESTFSQKMENSNPPSAAMFSTFIKNQSTQSDELPAVLAENQSGLGTGIGLSTMIWPFLSPDSGYDQDWPGPEGYYNAPRDGRMHEGVDIGANKGTPLYAVISGEVVSNEWNNGGGWMVEIRDSDGYTYRYLHMTKQSEVNIGTEVIAGKTIIGYCGSTGGDYPNHLHLSIYLPDSSQTIDPTPYLKAAQNRFEAGKP